MKDEVILNGWKMSACQYTTDLLYAEKEGAAAAIQVGHNYAGIDEFGRDIMEEQGFVVYLGGVILLEEGMWVVGPDPVGNFIPLTNQQFELFFKD